MSTGRALDFLGLPLAPVTAAEFIDLVITRARARERTRITYLNAMAVNTAAEDADYRACVRAMDLVYADGQAIVWAARWLGTPVPERVNAGDFFEEFCRRCAQEGLRLFLLGSPEGRAEAAAARLRQRVPGVDIAGTHHGYLTPALTPAVLAAVNAARPDILILGMGVPQQEKWLHAHAGALDVPVGWCVGALLDYHAGAFRRAPRWMRRAGLEWLFRLALEPRRLWRRYLGGNPRFVWRVLRRRRLNP